jgi:hypothetical protein
VNTFTCITSTYQEKRKRRAARESKAKEKERNVVKVNTALKRYILYIRQSQRKRIIVRKIE